jgi:RNA polymerase sigma factor (TIGR02999 family)
MMRRVLVDHARARNRLKRQHDDGLPGLMVTTGDANTAELIDLDRALERFSARFPRQTKMVEMRYFAGLEIEEIAACLDLSPATVKRDWQFARAWLVAELSGVPNAEPGP